MEGRGMKGVSGLVRKQRRALALVSKKRKGKVG